MCLVLAFFNSAALWLLIEAEFLAIVLVLVYVGAVMVLFLFVVMMLDVNVEEARHGIMRYAPLGLAVAALMVFELLQIIWYRTPACNECSGGRIERHRRPSNTEGAGRCAVHRARLCVRTGGGGAAAAIVAAIALTMRRRPGSRCRISPETGRRRPAKIACGWSAWKRRKVMIGLGHYLTLAAVLFAISVAGIFINRKNVIVLLMCVSS